MRESEKSKVIKNAEEILEHCSGLIFCIQEDLPGSALMNYDRLMRNISEIHFILEKIRATDPNLKIVR